MKVTLVAVTQPTVVDPKDGSILSAEELITYAARVSSPQNQHNIETAPKLLGFCIRKKHWSVFEQASMTVEIETSLAIATQILRHRSFTFQMFSQRYAAADNLGDDLFEPVELRGKHKDGNRQGSSENIGSLGVEHAAYTLDERLESLIGDAKDAYKILLANGVAPECARMVLPQCTRTRLYMTGCVRSWIHYLDQRLDNHAQKEHREVAREIKKIFDAEFPNIAKALANRVEYAAQAAYEAYCATRDWKSYRGEPLPQWVDVEDGIKVGWRAAAQAVL